MACTSDAMLQRVALLIVLLFVFVVCAASVDNANQDPDMHEFSQFMKSHRKTYSTNDMTKRFAIFKSNLNFIKQHNAANHSYTVGVNAFTDLTEQEFARTHLLCFNEKLALESNLTHAQVNNTLEKVEDKDIPAAVDWRDKGAVNVPEDQATCGSCWTFSSTASAEAANFLANQTLQTLSEQECLDCAKNGAYTCATGGIMNDCFAYLIKNGALNDTSYPYENKQGSCRVDADAVVAHFTSFSSIKAGSETALKVLCDVPAAAATTVVSVAINASGRGFQLYKKGVYDQRTCTSRGLNHAVAVVGYGNDPATRKDYWIVKNSWGASWGMDGYILMARNKANQCGIASMASYIIA